MARGVWCRGTAVEPGASPCPPSRLSLLCMSELLRARTITSDLVGAAMVFRAKILGAAIFAGLSPLFVTSPPLFPPLPRRLFWGNESTHD